MSLKLETMMRPKFGRLDSSGEAVPNDYGNVFFRQPCGDSERLVIGPTGSQIQLLDSLASAFTSQEYYLLYILLLSHSGRSPGRYESPIVPNHNDLQLFIWTFQTFFENDGRHHLWVASPSSNDMLIYDQHDVVFAYGNLDSFESVLVEGGFKNAEFWFPSPHTHGFDPANAVVEDELIGYFDWKYYELQPGDEWD